MEKIVIFPRKYFTELSKNSTSGGILLIPPFKELDMYCIRCETPGENILAQKLLLKKGFRWASGNTEPMYTDRGQVLVLRGEIIRYRSLVSEDPEDCVEIGWGELSRL